MFKGYSEQPCGPAAASGRYRAHGFTRRAALGCVLLAAACGGKSETNTGKLSGTPADSDAASPNTEDVTSEVTDAGPSPTVTQLPPAQPTETEVEPTPVPSAPDPTDEPTSGESEPEPPETEPVESTPEPPPDEPVEPDAGAPPVEPNAPVWLYSQGAAQYVVKVNDPVHSIGPLSGVADASGLAPWSHDGRVLADIGADTEEIWFYALDGGGEPAMTVALPGPSRMMSWLGNVGVLVAVTLGDEGESVMLATLAGEVTPVVATTSAQAIAIYTTSPDGRHFVYSANDGQGSFVLYAIDMRDTSAPSMPEQLAVSNTSPHLSFLWSSDSHWLAYGVPGGSPAIFLWSPHSDDLPTAISAPDDQYTPLYSFSSTSDAFVCQVASAEVPSKLLLTPLSVSIAADGAVTGATVGQPVELARGESVSPATWSPAGDYIAYSTDEGSLLQSVNAGVGGERTVLQEWAAGCALEWADSEHFVRANCLAEEVEFQLVDVSDDMASTHVSASPTAGVHAGASCLLISDGSSLTVGAARAEATFQPLDTEGYDVLRVLIHPQGKGVVWLSQDSVIRWQPLVDCAPAPGSTVTVSGLAEVPSTLTLLPD